MNYLARSLCELKRNSPNFNILVSWAFDNFILANEFYAKKFTKPWNLGIS